MTDSSTGDSNQDSQHENRLENVDHEVRWLGNLEGLAVSETEEYGPVLFLHGDERSCAVYVEDKDFANGLSRAGVEIEEQLHTDSTQDGGRT
jgi:hypothetical protein